MAPPLVATREDGEVVLTPLSAEELAGVIDDLGRKVKLTPGLALHPLTMLMVRLAVTASQGVEPNGQGHAEDPEADPEADPEELLAVRKELQTALDRLGDAECQVRDLVNTTETGRRDLARQERELAEEKRRSAQARLAQAEAEALRQERNQLTDEYTLVLAMLDGDDPNAAAIEASPLAVRVQGVLNDLARMASEFGALRSMVHPAEAKVIALQAKVGTIETQAIQKKTELKRVRAKRDEYKGALRSVRDAVLTYQWSALSARHNFKGGKKCPCCPVCGGLDPGKVEGSKDVDHRRGCTLKALIQRL